MATIFLNYNLLKVIEKAAMARSLAVLRGRRRVDTYNSDMASFFTLAWPFEILLMHRHGEIRRGQKRYLKYGKKSPPPERRGKRRRELRAPIAAAARFNCREELFQRGFLRPL